MTSRSTVLRLRIPTCWRAARHTSIQFPYSRLTVIPTKLCTIFGHHAVDFGTSIHTSSRVYLTGVSFFYLVVPLTHTTHCYSVDAVHTNLKVKPGPFGSRDSTRNNNPDKLTGCFLSSDAQQFRSSRLSGAYMLNGYTILFRNAAREKSPGALEGVRSRYIMMHWLGAAWNQPSVPLGNVACTSTAIPCRPKSCLYAPVRVTSG
ncbi:hypothetical protein HD554DRAFT_722284 [Boletus coccyginus]|nr:hypothetical protein HD554DRAFT_722284 [Boletus coccyginus]